MSGAIYDKTKIYNLNKVNFDFPRWHTYEWANWDKLDAILAASGAAQAGDLWANSTLYTIGQRAFDGVSGYVYQALVTHTSAASGTFDAARIANPTYWKQVTETFNFRGLYQDGVLYYPGDVANVGYTYKMALVGYTSTVGSFNGSNWATLFSATGLQGSAAVQDTPPTGYDQGSTWFDSDSGVFYVRYGTTWVALNQGGGGSYIYATDAPPAGATMGTMWLDTRDMSLNAYYIDANTSQWVQINGPSTTGFRGARFYRNSAQSLPNAIVVGYLPNTLIYDTDGFLNVGASARITIPAGKGIKYVEVMAYFSYGASASGERYTEITYNGGPAVVADRRGSPSVAQGTLSTGPVAVNDGDYFILNIYQTSGGALNFELNSFFSIKVLN